MQAPADGSDPEYRQWCAVDVSKNDTKPNSIEVAARIAEG
jgi:hypothetical protein